jgi:D-3-phosphoglycerate dehydrogenase
MSKIVLLTNRIHERAFNRLSEEAEVRIASGVDEATLVREVHGVHGLIVRALITPAVLNAASSLQVVARHGVGLDFIPVAVASTRGIPVTFTPDANTESVAEHVVGAMIALAHHFLAGDRAVRSGDWERRHKLIGVDLLKRTVGVVGFGRIGSRVGQICRQAFSMRVLAYDPIIPEEAIRDSGAEPVTLNKVLAEADFITVHTPLNDKTRGLIGQDAFARMKRGAYFINAARGGIVDPVALQSALNSGRIRAAALDVFSKEPPDPAEPLFSMEQILLTPHSAAHTEEAMMRMGMDAAEDVLRVLRGDRPRYCANPEVLGQPEG